MPIRPLFRSFPPVAFALTALAVAQKPAKEPPPPADPATARYQECIKRLPFRFHVDGRETLARTKTPAALATLIKDYSTTKAYPEYARYTIARMFGRFFVDSEAVPALTALRAAAQKPVDAWLWTHALTVQAKKASAESVLPIALQDKNTWQRAAAMLALGEVSPGLLGQAIAETCRTFPKKEKEADRNLLIGAMSGAIRDNKGQLGNLEFKLGVAAYIKLLADDVALTHTAKIQIARHLMLVLNGPALFINPEPWLELLERGDVKKPAGGTTVVQPRFFGIESEGERLCYVVDMSDSMCRDISPGVKPPQGPLTGPKKKPKGQLLDESDLPWHKIKTRWDLAREQLKISLLRLTPDKHFSVVWFGSESGTLDSCPGMIKATAANVKKVVAELDGIVTGPPDGDKAPEGTLRGTTNMHSGLRRAFGLTEKGYVDAAAYVDPAALTQGCDTIFLLSDGAPSWDDFHIKDKDYGEGEVVLDTEYGKKMPRQPEINYHGPYDQPEWLVADVERMNAFRRIRIHCIGIGEANMALMRQLADVGYGETYEMGKKEAAGAGGGGRQK